MRAIAPNIAPYHYSPSVEPRYVVAITFDDAGTDILYLTSHVDTPVPVGADQVFLGVIESVSGTTQKINPDQGISTIGNISFTAVDYVSELTTFLAAKDAAGFGIRQRKVQVYFGFDGLTWPDFEANLIQTQIVDKVTTAPGGLYTFKCADVQRSARSDIFEVAVTSLSQTMNDTQMLVPVFSVDGFQLLAHGASYTDAPNTSVLYVQIEDEVIRCSGTTTDIDLGLCFVVHTNGRGALGTRPAVHQVDTGSSTDQKTEVTEFVYLEMPGIKLALAILTGNLYGQPGESLPEKWHLGIAGTYIRTTDFVEIGVDLWDTATDDGLVVRFAGEKKQDAKKFIEEQICLLCATDMPIYSNGELGMKRFTSVLSGTPPVFNLNLTNIVQCSPVDVNTDQVFNLLSVEWNYDFLQDKLTRQKILIDDISIAKYRSSPSKSLKFRGLNGSRHTATTVEGLFDRLRDRFAAPPMTTKVRVMPYLNFLEVGDIVNVNFPAVGDPFTGEGLNRSFEIQQVAVNWFTGQVDLTLFGSTQPASVLKPEQPSDGPSGTVSVLSDAWYTASGTNLAGYGGITSSVVGDLRHITGGTGLVGDDNINNARYYHVGDLELDSGVTLPFTKNVMLVVQGHLQINGTFDGSARGKAGAAQVPAANYDSNALGTAGFLGPTVSGGGYYDEFRRISGHDNDQRWLNSTPGYTVMGQYTSTPRLAITYDPNTDILSGLPTDLQGTSGSTGHVTDFSESAALYIRGGAGGKSGGGILIVARGVSFGAAGTIKTDGENGGAPDGPTGLGYAGAGAGGAPGAVYILIDGLNNDVPAITHVQARWGQSHIPDDSSQNGTPLTAPSVMVRAGSTAPVAGPYYSHYVGFGNTPPDLSGAGAGRIQYIPPVNNSGPDTPVLSQSATAIALHELINTPASPAGNLSTIEVTVTPPSDTTYRYSNIYYRVGTAAWVLAGPADDELPVTVASDGTTYEFWAKPVSAFNREADFGPKATITVIDVIHPPVNNSPVPDALPVPNIKGLEIVNQGNNTEFVGRDINLVWRRSTLFEWISPITNTSPINVGSLDLYFSHYEIYVFDPETGELMRRFSTPDPKYTYGYAMNAEDTKRIVESLGQVYTFPRRRVRFEVYQWSRQNLRSAIAAKLVVQNTAPGFLENVSIDVGVYSIVFRYTPPADPDWDGVDIWVYTVSGTPTTEDNITHFGPDTAVSFDGLSALTDYYLVYRPYDAFSAGEKSTEYHITTGQVSGVDLSGLGPWATKLDAVDAAWINAQFANDAIPSTKIANLTAAKITTGVLIATITIQSLGSIVIQNGSFVTTLGIHTVSAVEYAMRTFDGATSSFSVTSNGILSASSAVISGTVTIGSGSGYANISDKPTNLAGINGTEGTKLSGIAAGADVTQAALIVGTTITGGGIVMSAGGSIKGGKTSPGSGTGFFLGYSGGAYQLDVGDTTNEKFIRFDGTDVILGKRTKFKSFSSVVDNDVFLKVPFPSLQNMSVISSGGGFTNGLPANITPFTFGYLKFTTTATTGNLQVFDGVPGNGTPSLLDPDWSKPRIINFAIATSASWDTTVTGYFGSGKAFDSVDNFVGFKMTSTGLYGYAQKFGVSTTSSLLWAFVADTVLRLRIECDGAGNADLYKDGVLLTTMTTNVPHLNTDTSAALCYNAGLSKGIGTSTVDTVMFIGEYAILQKSS